MPPSSRYILGFDRCGLTLPALADAAAAAQQQCLPAPQLQFKVEPADRLCPEAGAVIRLVPALEKVRVRACVCCVCVGGKRGMLGRGGFTAVWLTDSD
jgi:hypothetical protein